MRGARSRQGRGRAWGLAVAALVLVAGACGDDGGLSEDDFVRAWDRACNRADRDLDGLDDPQSFEDVVDIAEDARDIAEDALDDLRDLQPPSDLEDDVDDLLELMEEQLDLIDELKEAGEDEDEAELNRVNEEAEALADDAVDLAEEIGLDCPSPDGDDDDVDEPVPTVVEDPVDPDAADLGDGVPPAQFIEEFGTDVQSDILAEACFAGDFESCDVLYTSTPVAETLSSYEGYGATCGGRLVEPAPRQCLQLAQG